MTFDTRAPLAIQASRTINVGRGSITSNSLIVYEDFEDFQQYVANENGFMWRNTFAASAQTDITDPQNTVLRFSFSNNQGDDAFSEIKFEFEEEEHELWIKYRLYIPSNYNHPDPAIGGGSTNSKLYFMLESVETSSLSNLVAISGWPSNGGTQMMLNAKVGNTFSSHINTDSDGRSNIMAISPEDFGSWQKMVARIFLPPVGESTGRVTIWLNDSVAGDWRDLPLNSTPGAENSGIKKGYFLGWMNSGVSEPFDMQMDDVFIGRTAESIGEGGLT